MKIHDRHLYHGAALIQIAEHPKFTSINSYKPSDISKEYIFKVNNSTIVYLKYAYKPLKKSKEFKFSFTRENLADIHNLKRNKGKKVFIVLICVTAREVCCLTYLEFNGLINKNYSGAEQQTISVTAPKNNYLRVYGAKTKEDELKIPRGDFPGILFNS